jgi:hypothetical protein
MSAVDWASVNWLYVAVLAGLAFFSTLVGTLLSFKHVFGGALFSALLFAAAFVFWTYYPHGLPLPTSLVPQKPPATAAGSPAPAAPSTPNAPDKPPGPPSSSPPANSQ